MIKYILVADGKDRTEGDIHAHHGTCTGELTGSVLHQCGFSRDQAFGGSSKPGKSAYPSSYGFSAYCYRSGRQKIQNIMH